VNKVLLAALSGQRVDPVPIWLMRQAGRYLPEYRALRAKAGSFLDLCYTPELAIEATMQPIRRFGFDAAILFSDILVVPDGLGQKVEFREGDGPILKGLRSGSSVDGFSIDRMIEHLQPVYAAVKGLRRELPKETALIGFAGAPWTVATYMVEGRGGSDHAETRRFAYREPEIFAGLISLLIEATLAHLSAQIEAGVEVVQIFDSWAGSLPEQEFRAYALEPARRIVAELHRKYPAVRVIAFPRGAGAMLPVYARECAADAVSLDSSVPTGWAAAAIQDRGQCVQGNLDPAVLVAGGDPLFVAADRILGAFAHGPHVFNLGHGILPETPLKHVAQLIERVREARSA